MATFDLGKTKSYSFFLFNFDSSISFVLSLDISTEISTGSFSCGSVIVTLYSGPNANIRAAIKIAFLSPIIKSLMLRFASTKIDSNSLSKTIPFLIKFVEVKISSSFAVKSFIVTSPLANTLPSGYTNPLDGNVIVSVANG